jgi:8-oxo-dGTP pyrophosphatase MutT (NUDIX family)
MSDLRREAAVTLAIIAAPPHGVVFVERATHLRDHPGQVALPGGSLDAADEGDHARAALRELHEEIGVVPERVTIVRRLPMVRQSVNNFDVTPFVAVVAPGPFAIDGTETAGMFTIPLEVLVAEGPRPGLVTLADRTVDTYVMQYEGRRVWGLTAKIVRTFADAWHDAKSGMRAAVEDELAAS